MDDTQPIVIKNRGVQRVIGFFSLIGALGFTAATVALLMSPTPEVVIEPTTIPVTQIVFATPEPTITPIVESVVIANVLPTLSADSRQQLLLEPASQVVMVENGRVVRDAFDPFTVIPQRARTEVIKYTVVAGDTISGIADKFGISQESIAWSNDRRFVWGLRPGIELNIPPADGVYYQAVGSKTLAELTTQFKINDPYLVVDSPYNPMLFGFDPNSVPPSGTWIFFPGGQAEGIDWNPPSLVSGGTSGTSGGGDGVGFAVGDPGSCGYLEPGLGTAWYPPLAGGYTVTQGFSSWHSGIDLSAAEGTSVYAANGGRVIFAGRNTWGYGLAVVISSGPFTTLYGHLSQVSVSCGQVVTHGQVIGAVGNTGISSGPHLHFEIMSNGIRTDPAATMPF